MQVNTKDQWLFESALEISFNVEVICGNWRKWFYFLPKLYYQWNYDSCLTKCWTDSIISAVLFSFQGLTIISLNLVFDLEYKSFVFFFINKKLFPITCTYERYYTLLNHECDIRNCRLQFIKWLIVISLVTFFSIAMSVYILPKCDNLNIGSHGRCT